MNEISKVFHEGLAKVYQDEATTGKEDTFFSDDSEFRKRRKESKEIYEFRWSTQFWLGIKEWH